MKLFISEKPGITTALVQGVFSNSSFSGQITTGTVDGEDAVVVTTNGHMMTLKNAWEQQGITKAEYDENYSKTKENFKFNRSKEYQEFLKVGNAKLKEIKKEIDKLIPNKSNVELICVTDPDDEGKQIYVSVMQYLGFDPEGDNSYDVYTGAVSPEALKSAYKNKVKFNRPSEGGNVSASKMASRARARAMYDALTGFNYTYALYKNMGRLKGALLSVVCDIEDKKRNFKEIKTYRVDALVNGETFMGSYKFETQEAAEAFANEMKSKGFTVNTSNSAKSKKTPPFHTLTTLNKTLESKVSGDLGQIANDLRLQKQMISYYRTSKSDIKDVTAKSLQKNIFKFQDYNALQPLNFDNIGNVPSRFVTKDDIEHEGIHVTGKTTPLSGDELVVFDEILRRNLASMGKDIKFTEYRNELNFATDDERYQGYSFIEKVITDKGYLVNYPSDEFANVQESELKEFTNDNIDTSIREVITKPKGHYSKARLLEKMENIQSDIEDKELKAIYKEVKGIGQPATVDGTIKDMIAKGFFKGGKLITPTEDAMNLYYYLKENNIALIDLKSSALMEVELDKVKDGTLDSDTFVDKVEVEVDKVTALIHKTFKSTSKGGNTQVQMEDLNVACPICGKKVGYVQVKEFNIAKCEDSNCKFVLFTNVSGKTIPKTKIKPLIEGQAIPMKGLKGKKGTFDTNITLDMSGEKPALKFNFDDVKKDDIFENKKKTGFIYKNFFISKTVGWDEKVKMTKANAKKLIDNGSVVVDGKTVTLTNPNEATEGNLTFVKVSIV